MKHDIISPLILASLLFMTACKKKEADPVNNTPTACFQTSKVHYHKMESIRFSNCSSNYDHAEWYFGDGGESKYSEPDYKYVSPGIYSIRLKSFNGVNSSEANKQLWIADTMRVGYTMSWDSTMAKQGDLIILRIYYQKKGEANFAATFQYPSSYTSGNLVFGASSAGIAQSGFIDVPDPSESLLLKIVASCYTGTGILPTQLAAKDSILTQDFDGFNGLSKPDLSSIIKVGKLRQHYTMAHR